jgi:hypothetical protein
MEKGQVLRQVLAPEGKGGSMHLQWVACKCTWVSAWDRRQAVFHAFQAALEFFDFVACRPDDGLLVRLRAELGGEAFEFLNAPQEGRVERSQVLRVEV